MNDDAQTDARTELGPAEYRPPAITYLGSLADLTAEKEVGAADGATFLGVDIGSV